MQVSSKSLYGLGLVLFFEPEMIDRMPQASWCTATWCQSVDLHSHQIRSCCTTQQSCAAVVHGCRHQDPLWDVQSGDWLCSGCPIIERCDWLPTAVTKENWAGINFSHPRSLRYLSWPLCYCSSAGFGGNPAFVLYLRLSHHTMRQRKIRYFIDDNMFSSPHRFAPHDLSTDLLLFFC